MDFYGIFTIVGPILLLAAFAWAMLNNRRSAAERQRTEDATRRMYDAQNADDKAAETRIDA